MKKKKIYIYINILYKMHILQNMFHSKTARFEVDISKNECFSEILFGCSTKLFH